MRNKVINRDPNNMEIQLYYHAIDKCLEIVKFHKDNWDGIEWAIRDIEELREGGNNGTDNQ